MEEIILASRNNKVIKYKKPLNINIGVIIFGIIFIYLCLSVIIYIINPKISVYEVSKGSLAVDNSYTGIALRTETVINADKAGYINFYAREGEKVGVGQTVYTVDETGKLAQTLADAASSGSSLSENDITSLKTEITSFKNNFSNADFSSVYSFKNSVQNMVLELVNINMLNSITSLDGEAGDLGVFTACTAPNDGLVVYSIDGYEKIAAENLTEEMFNQENYTKKIIKSSDLVNAGDPVYKIITDESWSIVIPLEEEKAAELSERETIQIKFKKDGVKARALFSIYRINGKPYAKLDLSNSCIRYASDRFINIELILSTVEGLKIPVSSVIEKPFYTIPVEYAAKGGDSSSVGFVMEVYDDNGKAEQKFISPTIYYSTEDDYFVDTHEFEVGAYIIKTDSTDRYQIGKTQSLTGVYNINKGYAVFKQIDILYENEEYYIVEEGTTYGLSVYDHIVLDGEAVEEDDIIY